MSLIITEKSLLPIRRDKQIINSGSTTLGGGGAGTPIGMIYPDAGIAYSTGSAWGASITNNSTNWNTAYTDRLKWDGGSTDLVAATGRTSLGLNTGATADISLYATLASPTFTGKVTITSGVNDWGLLINSPNTAGQSYGLGINAGTNSTDHGLVVGNAAGTSNYLKVRGDGWISMGHGTPTAPLHLSYTGTHKFRITHTGVSAFAIKSAADGTSWHLGLEHDRTMNIGRNDANDIIVHNTSGAISIPNGIRIGDTAAPTEKLEVAGNGIITGSLLVYSS